LPSRKRNRRSSSRWINRLFFVTTLLLILTGLSIIYQERLEDIYFALQGDPLPVDRGLTPAGQLEEAVILGAREMGVPQKRIGRPHGVGEVPLYEFRCPDRLHPLTANRWLSRVFRDAGVEILDCVEEGTLQRPKLRYSLAAGQAREARAMLVVYPPKGAPPLQRAWPRLAIIIDDFGHNFGRVPRELLNLGIPITASILPGRPSSGRVRKEALKKGHAVFMHLPMEPKGYPDNDPGPGALFTTMSADSISDLLRQLGRDFKQFDGVNHHMGSLASTRESVVRPYLEWAREEGLLVVDSFTASGSVVYPLARKMNIPSLRMDLFLDGEEENEAEIMENIAQAADIARSRGWVVVIAHPRPETLLALKNMVPRLKDYGIRFVTVTELFESLGDSDPSPPPPSRVGPH
jgi:uncharacterized protein